MIAPVTERYIAYGVRDTFGTDTTYSLPRTDYDENLRIQCGKRLWKVFGFLCVIFTMCSIGIAFTSVVWAVSFFLVSTICSFLGLFLGVGLCLAFLKEFADESFKEIDNAEDKLFES